MRRRVPTTPPTTHTAPFDGNGRRPLRGSCGQRLDGFTHVFTPQQPSCPACRQIETDDATTLATMQTEVR